jgi:methylthioribulose-1-phosphate dehydratase
MAQPNPLLVRTASTKPNPFPQPGPLAMMRLRRLLTLAQRSYQRGWHPGTGGNFSVRESVQLMWQSPSGVPKGDLQVAQFLPVDIQQAAMIGPAPGKPSDETPLHAVFYRLDPQANTVIHGHCPGIIRWARQAQSFCGQELQKVFAKANPDQALDICVLDNTQDMTQLAKQLASSTWPREPKVLVLRDHGAYAWGREPDEAFNRLESLEFLCLTQIQQP